MSIPQPLDIQRLFSNHKKDGQRYCCPSNGFRGLKEKRRRVRVENNRSH